LVLLTYIEQTQTRSGRCGVKWQRAEREREKKAIWPEGSSLPPPPLAGQSEQLASNKKRKKWLKSPIHTRQVNSNEKDVKTKTHHKWGKKNCSIGKQVP
jgi:hypothetical protein